VHEQMHEVQANDNGTDVRYGPKLQLQLPKGQHEAENVPRSEVKTSRVLASLPDTQGQVHRLQQ